MFKNNIIPWGGVMFKNKVMTFREGVHRPKKKCIISELSKPATVFKQ